MTSSTGRDDIPEGDAVEQERPADPDHRPDPPLDTLSGVMAEAGEADALDQRLDAGQDDDDLADRG